MLMPKKVRHRKQQRGRMDGVAKGATRVNFGDYGLQALEPGCLPALRRSAPDISFTICQLLEPREAGFR